MSHMSRGRAIIEARKLIGPKGAISLRGLDQDHCVGHETYVGGFSLVASGRDWDEAIRKTRAIIASQDLNDFD